MMVATREVQMNRENEVHFAEAAGEPCRQTRLKICVSTQHEDTGVPSVDSDCEVIEYNRDCGYAMWVDSVYVRDFTDSVLETIPGTLTS
jgi:hypothetical protein